MIASGALDDHDHVLDVVTGHGGANSHEGGVEAGSVMLDRSRLDQDSAVEVGDQDLGAGLGAVDAHEGEVFGPDRDDARVNDAKGLVKGVLLRLVTVFWPGLDSHGTDLRIELRRDSTPILESVRGISSKDF